MTRLIRIRSMHDPTDRRTFLAQTTALLGSASLASAKHAKPAELIGWPAAHGPNGNFTPHKYGHKLIDDLANAKTEWKSEDSDLGYGKGSVSGYLKNLATWPGHPGSCSGPIVDGELVLCSSFRPTGSTWAIALPQLRGEKGRKHMGKKLQQNLRIDADDLLVAIDRKTGKTKWKAIEKSNGVNLYMGKREGFGVAPTVFDGSVFSMGTTGRLYAYQGDTGKRLWESDIGKAHRRMEGEKKLSLAAKTLPRKIGWNASLVVAQGVLIVPLYDNAIDMGLRGVNPRSGKTLWELPAITSRYATPSVWRTGNREYLLTATRKGTLNLIDPSRGKVLWSVGGLQGTYFSLTPTENQVFVNVGSPSGRSQKRNLPFGLIGAYSLSIKAGKRVWTMPDRKEFWFENHMDSCARRKLAVADGKVYYFAANKAGGTRLRKFSILDETSGKVLYSGDTIKGHPHFYPIEDRLLSFPDPSHSDRLTAELYAADPRKFRRLGSEWKPPHVSTTAYEVLMEIPYVDGRIFMRTRAGDVRCYDLRKKQP